jgi:hypothetical protein
MGVSLCQPLAASIVEPNGCASKRMSKMASSIRNAANDWGSVTNAQKHAFSYRKSGSARIGALARSGHSMKR